MLAPLDAEIGERVSWLIQLRWLAIVGTMLAITAAAVLLPAIFPIALLFAVAALIGVYNLGFHLYAHTEQFRAQSDPRSVASVRFIYVQMSLDLFCLTLLLHFAGGIENPFWTFYVLHVIIASILLSRRAALAFAGLAVFLFGGLVALEYAGLIAHFNVRGIIDPLLYRQVTFLLPTALAFTTTLLFAALMATTIVGHVRQSDGDLLQCNVDLDTRSQQLTELNRRLAEIHELRNRFIVILTHDLRAPVAAIQGYLRLVLSNSVPAERQADIIARAERRATELLDRTANVLILTEIREKLTEREEVDLGDVLKQVVEEMQGAIEAKQLNMTVDVGTERALVSANSEQIRQIWMNLISNAIKYTPACGSIEAHVSHSEDTVSGTVRDSGIGIALEDQVRIFDEFFRSNAAKRVEQYGTGLGLSIAKEIVEGYGGRIQLVSAPEQGSTFTFTIPLACAPPAS